MVKVVRYDIVHFRFPSAWTVRMEAVLNTQKIFRTYMYLIAKKKYHSKLFVHCPKGFLYTV